MSAPLKLRTLVPIYALSGSPHPDTPQTPAGKAAGVEAEDARIPQRARAAGFPPAGGVSVFRPDSTGNSTNSFQIQT